MLVLAREVGQRIRIGPDIVIEVIMIGTKSMRLGIEAPKHVSIVREELVKGETDDEAVRDAGGVRTGV